MIRVERVPEPDDFGEKARRPGLAWLEQNADAPRPKDLWGPFKSALADGFGMRCGYSAMFEPVGTVDHFVSVHEDKQLAYEWSNYRYAAAWINSSKQNAAGILDPFEVQDDWFEILLPSLQLVVTDAVPAADREKAEYTLTRLHLAHDERVVRQRREWYRMYQDGELSLEGLRKKAPLIARAIETASARVELTRA